MIRVENLSFSYSKKSPNILNNVSFSLEKGEVGVLLGQNGSGKTTLFRCISGQEKHYSGKIIIGSKDLSSLSANEKAKLIACVPQLSSLESLSVYDTVLLGRLPYDRVSPSKHDQEIVERILEQLGLISIAMKSVSHISGGERQKAMIGMALAQESSIIILDEPTNNLDINAESDLFELLSNLSKSLQISILFSTHNIAFGYRYAQKFFLLDHDGNIESGDQSIITSDTLSHIFQRDILVESFKDDIIIRSRRETHENQ